MFNEEQRATMKEILEDSQSKLTVDQIEILNKVLAESRECFANILLWAYVGIENSYQKSIAAGVTERKYMDELLMNALSKGMKNPKAL